MHHNRVFKSQTEGATSDTQAGQLDQQTVLSLPGNDRLFLRSRELADLSRWMETQRFLVNSAGQLDMQGDKPFADGLAVRFSAHFKDSPRAHFSLHLSIHDTRNGDAQLFMPDSFEVKLVEWVRGKPRQYIRSGTAKNDLRIFVGLETNRVYGFQFPPAQEQHARLPQNGEPPLDAAVALATPKFA